MPSYSLPEHLNAIHYHGRCLFSKSAKSCFYDANIVFQCQFYIYATRKIQSLSFSQTKVNVYAHETIALFVFCTLKDDPTFVHWSFEMFAISILFILIFHSCSEDWLLIPHFCNYFIMRIISLSLQNCLFKSISKKNVFNVCIGIFIFYFSKQFILDKNYFQLFFDRHKPFPVFDTINFYFNCLMRE